MPSTSVTPVAPAVNPAAAALADPAAVSTVEAATGYLLSWLQAQVAYRRVPGAQVALRYGGRLLLDAAVGVADVTTGEPLRSDHLFRIASHSKTFTGTAVLQLVESGQLRLDDPVAAWLSELSDTPLGQVTLRELLGHQGGVLRDGVDADYWQLVGDFPDREALIDVVRRHGAVHRRNERFKYSNLGYGLLGLVIEAASGRSYAEQLAATVLEPLGLQRTGAEYDPTRAGEYAAGHTGLADGGERTTIDHVDTRALAAATGFYSTAVELSAYAEAHVPGDTRLLTDDSKRLMQRLESVVTPYGVEAGRYGVGMELVGVGARAFVGHSGGYPGHITRTLVDPADGLVVSVLTNAIDGPAHELALGLVKLVDLALNPGRGRAAGAAAGGPGPAGAARPRAGAAAARRTVPEGVTGRFTNLWGPTDLVELGGRLLLLHPTAPDPLAAVEEVEVTADGALRVQPEPGFGSTGEAVVVGPVRDGAPSWLRVGGMTAWSAAEYEARRPGLTRLPRLDP